jgi:hypothetical protein
VLPSTMSSDVDADHAGVDHRGLERAMHKLGPPYPPAQRRAPRHGREGLHPSAKHRNVNDGARSRRLGQFVPSYPQRIARASLGPSNLLSAARASLDEGRGARHFVSSVLACGVRRPCRAAYGRGDCSTILDRRCRDAERSQALANTDQKASHTTRASPQARSLRRQATENLGGGLGLRRSANAQGRRRRQRSSSLSLSSKRFLSHLISRDDKLVSGPAHT